MSQTLQYYILVLHITEQGIWCSLNCKLIEQGIRCSLNCKLMCPMSWKCYKKLLLRAKLQFVIVPVMQLVN